MWNFRKLCKLKKKTYLLILGGEHQLQAGGREREDKEEENHFFYANGILLFNYLITIFLFILLIFLSVGNPGDALSRKPPTHPGGTGENRRKSGFEV